MNPWLTIPLADYGFDQIDPSTTGRIFAMDINPGYTAEVSARYQSRLPGLRVLTIDIQTAALPAMAVDLVHAGLQLPSNNMPSVSTTRFTSLQRLSSTMRLVSPDELTALALRSNLSLQGKEIVQSSGGKMFAVQTFGRD